MSETLKPGQEHSQWKAPRTGPESKNETEKSETQRINLELTDASNKLIKYQVGNRQIDWDKTYSGNTLSRLHSAIDASLDQRGGVPRAQAGLEVYKKFVENLTEPDEEIRGTLKRQEERFGLKKGPSEENKSAMARKSEAILARYLIKCMTENGVERPIIQRAEKIAGDRPDKRADLILAEWTQSRQQTHPGIATPHLELLPKITTLK